MTNTTRLLLLVACAVGWFFAARANHHGIAPNTTLGFRSQHTLASVHGWYVAGNVFLGEATRGRQIVTRQRDVGRGLSGSGRKRPAAEPLAHSVDAGSVFGRPDNLRAAV
jgi:hypothetical protein